MIFNNNRNEKLLIELSKDLKAVAHKTGNVAQSVDNLTRVVYTDADSLVSQVALIKQKLITMKADLARHDEELGAQSSILKDLEYKSAELEHISQKREKFVNQVIAAVLAFVIPIGIMSSINTVTNVTEEPSRESTR